MKRTKGRNKRQTKVKCKRQCEAIVEIKGYAQIKLRKHLENNIVNIIHI